ncbi:hypothetical protein L208DRAFT_1253191, partial [Tricholoma matsutake]
MLNLADLCTSFSSFPSLAKIITLDDINKFLGLVCHFLIEIKLHVPPNSKAPPYRLPIYIHKLFCSCLGLDEDDVVCMWDVLKDVIWENPEQAYYMFYLPVSACVSCVLELSLRTLSRYEVSFHTLHNGTHRALSSSFACNACKIRYHHNYYTDNHLHLRYYYYSSTVPSNIQIEEHTFVDAKLCEFFTHLSLFAWVSAQNNANVFNHTLLDTSSGSTGDKTITSEQVSRAFVVNALLWESAENAAPLIVPDIGDNDERMKQAMELRNKRMIDEGQPHLMHACKVCEKFLPGSFRAVTMDGTSIGCPCCNVHNCTQPLLKHCAHFCAGHEYKKNECVVMDCGAPVQPGFWTCANLLHRALEQYRNEKGKAFFQLKQRLQKSNASHGSDSMGQL